MINASHRMGWKSWEGAAGEADFIYHLYNRIFFSRQTGSAYVFSTCSCSPVHSFFLPSTVICDMKLLNEIAFPLCFYLTLFQELLHFQASDLILDPLQTQDFYCHIFFCQDIKAEGIGMKVKS